jgi:rod shape-determining protein MreD
VRLLKLLATVIPVLIAALLLHAVAGETIGSGLFDPYLIMTVWFGANGRKPDGMIVGAMAGLVQDAMGSVVIGTHFLSKVVVGYVVMMVAARLIPGQVVTHAVLLAAGAILEVVVLTAAGLLFGMDLAPGPPLAVILWLLTNVVLGTMVFSLVESARRRRERGFGRGSRGR